MNAMKSLSGGAFQPVKTPFDGCNGNGEVSTSAHPASLLPAARKTEQIAAWFDGDDAWSGDEPWARRYRRGGVRRHFPLPHHQPTPPDGDTLSIL